MGQNPEGYFMANRSFKTAALFFTVLATNFSAYYFLGFAGQGYRVGYAFYFVMSIGTALACFSFFVIGTKVWREGKKHKYITPAELIYGKTGSRSLALVFSFIMLLFTFPYLSLQIVGAGYLLESLTNNEIPYMLGASLITVFTVTYVFIGGMTSVVRTDMKQGILMVLLMCVAVVTVVNSLGGFTEANYLVRTKLPELFSSAGNGAYYTPKRWLSWLVFWFFCIPMFPQIFMRFFIAKDVEHLKKTGIMYAISPFFVTLLPVIIGVLGHIHFSGLEAKAADSILPKMLSMYAPSWLAALVMVGALAAMMSTLDSQLLSLTTMMTRDFHLALSKDKLTFKQQISISKVWIVFFALIGLAIAYQPFATIFDMGKMAFSGLSVLFPTAFVVLYFKKVSTGFCLASILVGEVLTLAFFYKWVPNTYAFGFEPFIIVLLIVFLLVGLGIYTSVKR